MFIRYHNPDPENKNIINLIKGIIIVPSIEKGVTIPIKINPNNILGP
jgi:hypothetical protein